MRRQGKLILILVIILIPLLIGTILLLSKQPPAEEEEKETDLILLEHAQEYVKTISLDVGGKQTTIRFEDGDFSVDTIPERVPLDSSAVAELMGELEQVKAIRSIEEPKALEDYGLETPVSTVHVDYSDGQEATILLGNEAPGELGTYLKLAEDETIYLVDTASVSRMKNTIADFLDRKLGPMLPGNQIGTIRFRNVFSEDLIILKHRQNAEMYAKNHHYMTSPVEAEMDEDAMKTFIGYLSGTTATVVVAVNPTEDELRTTGLLIPSAICYYNYEDGGMESVLYAGNTAGGYVYVMKDDIPAIYLVSEEAVPWREMKAEELLPKEG